MNDPSPPMVCPPLWRSSFGIKGLRLKVFRVVVGVGGGGGGEYHEGRVGWRAASRDHTSMAGLLYTLRHGTLERQWQHWLREGPSSLECSQLRTSVKFRLKPELGWGSVE